MSDKEFDTLFKNRFDEFEVNPSESVWAGIDNQLGNKKRRIDLPLFWMAAASVVLVFAVGLYLLRPNKTIRLYNGDAGSLVATEVVPDAAKQQPLVEDPAVRKQRIARHDVQPVKKSRMSEVKDDTEVTRLETSEVINVAAISDKIVTQEDPLNTEPLIIVPVGSEEKMITSLLPDTVQNTSTGVAGRARIKSVGDLVNFVIAKVDQREDKIIEMTDNDEGTSISGINLGILKIKSVKKNGPSGFKVNFK